MKLLLNLGLLCLVSCVTNHKDSDDQLGLCSNTKYKDVPNYTKQSKKSSHKKLTSFNDGHDDDSSLESYSFKSPFSDPDLANAFDLKLEKCITKSGRIATLFLRNKLKCGVESMTMGMDQSELVRYSKRYVLNLFHLPSRDKIQYLVTLPDDQFQSHFFDLLRSIRVDPSNAALNGKEFIQDLIDRTPNGISTIRTILSYYWSANSFRYDFLNRAFSTISHSLSDQEYFEFESLLDWIQTDFIVMSIHDWDELKLKFQNHYKSSKINPKHWKAWYDMRPLKERELPE